jgi:predicted PurR-regulated permease PerM
VAQSLVVPFLLATFFSIILAPLMHAMQKRGLPSSIALSVIVIACVLVSGSVSYLVGSSINQFRETLRDLPSMIDERLLPIEQQLREWTTIASDDAEAADEIPGLTPDEELRPFTVSRLNLQTLMTDYLGQLLSGLASVLSNAFIILITVIFMLLEAARFPAKMTAAFGHSHPAQTNIEQIVADVRRYMVIKSTTSALTGILVFGLLVFLKIPYPFLWAILAFLFNFVPNIGSIIAAIPPVLLALVAPEHGVLYPVVTAIGYLIINVLVSFGIEPRFMGQGLGLSTLVVFLSLVFWGWVLGPVGMLLSAPLTMIVKIGLENSDDSQWIAVLMGSKAPHPDQTEG